jgi:hypothetical protein
LKLDTQGVGGDAKAEGKDTKGTAKAPVAGKAALPAAKKAAPSKTDMDDLLER